MNNKFFNAAKKDDTLTLSFYDLIGGDFYGEGATPAVVAAALKGSDFKSIEVHLNSPGGDAFAGVAIYSLLKACSKPVNVIVDGLAASAASIVAMAGDTITMHTGSVMMIHEAMSTAFGNADDMRKTADILDTVTSGIADIYVAKTGLDKQIVLDMQNAETWMTPTECVDKGFATFVSKDSAVKNSFDLSKFRNLPSALKPEAEPEAKDELVQAAANDCSCECQPCVDGDCADCSHDSCDCAGCTCPQHDEVSNNFDLNLYTKQLELNKRK